MLIHLWELLILLTGDYGATVMAAIQVPLIIIVISIEDPKETHNMPYILKRKRPPRNGILAYSNHLMNMVCMRLDVWINTGAKRHRKQHRKWKTRNNKQRRNKIWLAKGHCNMHTMSMHFQNNLRRNSFDSDSHPLMFNDEASASITNDLQDFVIRPTLITQKVKGIAGSAKATYRRTVKWKIEDDNNIMHMFTIPNTYYIANAPTRILSPQHFAQQMQDHKPHAEGTGCTTTSTTIGLFWNQRKFTKTVKLDSKLNIAMTNTAPGIKQYKSYIMNQGEASNRDAHIFKTHIIPKEESVQGHEDDDLSFQPLDPIQAFNKSGTDHQVDHIIKPATGDTQQTHNDTPTAEEFSLELLHTIPDDREPTTISAQDEFMRWHYCLNHLPFKRMFKMAKQGLLAKKILKANVPICPACQYGKMHRKPWRTKGNHPKTSRVATEPGQIVSVDQLESPMPGFIAQLKGTLTKQ